MAYDGHVHIRPGKANPVKLLEDMNECSISGGLLISLSPDKGSFESRLENLLEWTSGYDSLMPFFWIDPLESGAAGQVGKAVENGIAGFKIICDRFYPGDSQCMSVCRMAAEAEKPILFHSGILWDGKPSSEYCRPVHFESLLTIGKLRFSLAHIGWPWCDETIAVYGKFLNYRTKNPKSETEMFIDITPGTPPAYRGEVLRKLFLTGYDIGRNVIFGSDCDANSYNKDWTTGWMAADSTIYSGLDLEDNVIDGIYEANLIAFVNGSETGRDYKDLLPAFP